MNLDPPPWLAKFIEHDRYLSSAWNRSLNQLYDYVVAIATSGSAGGITSLTGDVTATGPGAANASLSTTGVTAGTYTNANIVVGADGRLTSATDGTSGTGGGGGSGISALTGDVTATGTGTVTATIPNDTVTYAKMQNFANASRLLGRRSSSAGDPEEIVLGSGLSMSTDGTLTSTATSSVGDDLNWQHTLYGGI